MLSVIARIIAFSFFGFMTQVAFAASGNDVVQTVCGNQGSITLTPDEYDRVHDTNFIQTVNGASYLYAINGGVSTCCKQINGTWNYLNTGSTGVNARWNSTDSITITFPSGATYNQPDSTKNICGSA